MSDWKEWAAAAKSRMSSLGVSDAAVESALDATVASGNEPNRDVCRFVDNHLHNVETNQDIVRAREEKAARAAAAEE